MTVWLPSGWSYFMAKHPVKDTGLLHVRKCSSKEKELNSGIRTRGMKQIYAPMFQGHGAYAFE